MENSRRLQATKIVVIISIILSFGSIATIKLGLGEIYPFFFWKLYSQPLGWENTEADFRIYASNGKNCSFNRLQIKVPFTFSIEEYVYALNRHVNDYLKDKNERSLQRLKLFVLHVEPNYERYKIVKEKYHPLEYKEKNATYDTLTVITF